MAGCQFVREKTDEVSTARDPGPIALNLIRQLSLKLLPTFCLEKKKKRLGKDGEKGKRNKKLKEMKEGVK